jgi:ATP-dependent DNA helicase PIF1
METSLNIKQKEAFNLFKKGNNLCITGPAGVGKSYLISLFKKWAINNNKVIAVTAMTGNAAYLINGKTLHSWAGIGIGDLSEEMLLSKIRKNFVSKKKWLDTNILIIDEVSMLTGLLLSKLNYLGMEIRRNPYTPFGGIQVVLLGDFYQLPPVKNEDFVFESAAFKEYIEEIIDLDEIVRQKDVVFQRILNNIRVNKLIEDDIKILKSRTYKEIEKNNPNFKQDLEDMGIKPTKIYTLKKNVEEINNQKLLELKNEIKVFLPNTNVENKDKYEFKQNEIDKFVDILDNSGRYENMLKLCVGAQVMFLINKMDLGLVNGSRGVVVDFKDNYPVVKFNNGITEVIKHHSFDYEIDKKGIIYRKQIPLRLAWCITVHKSQGMSIDIAEVDIGSNIFEYGQTYVALSRVRSLDGLYIIKFNPDKIKCHPKVEKFYNNLQQVINKKELNKNNIKSFFA